MKIFIWIPPSKLFALRRGKVRARTAIFLIYKELQGLPRTHRSHPGPLPVLKVRCGGYRERESNFSEPVHKALRLHPRLKKQDFISLTLLK